MGCVPHRPREENISPHQLYIMILHISVNYLGLYVGSGLKPKPKYQEPKTQETEPMGLEVGFKHGVNIQVSLFLFLR